MFRKYYNYENVIDETTEQQVPQMPIFMEPSPCTNIENDHVCKKYCTAHENLIGNYLSIEEFLTLMKLSIPQRKLKYESLSDAEMSLFSKIFGQDNLKDNLKRVAPMALVIFCKYKRSQFWQGDQLANSTQMPRFCNDFQFTPNDLGMCLTKGLDVEKLATVSKYFKDTFEVSKITTNKIEGMTSLTNQISLSI